MAQNISILGNIGAGKSTLATLIAREVDNIRYLKEPSLDQNPYLDVFTRSPKHAALHHQLWFLITGLEIVAQRITCVGSTVQDSSLLACPIFAEAMAHVGYMDLDDYRLYDQLCHKVIDQSPPPTLYIIVQASISTLTRRIKTRARKSECEITERYLGALQELHDTKLIDYWIARRSTKAIFIDTDCMDLREPSAAQQIVNQIKFDLANEP